MGGLLRDRVAIVTGAGDGIGRGIVQHFAREGARIVIAEIDADAGHAAERELRSAIGAEVVSIATDMRDKDAIQALVAGTIEAFGAVDILVNNGWGGYDLSRLENKADGVFQNALALGVYGPLWGMQAVFPVMKAKGYGRIVNMCSVSGVNAFMGNADYNTAKEALRALTRTAAREWAPYGIVANALCPGAKSATVRATFSQFPELEDLANKRNPMGRLGDPETDIGPVAAFLASEGARYLTGNTLYVDGGVHINGTEWTPELPD